MQTTRAPSEKCTGGCSDAKLQAHRAMQSQFMSTDAPMACTFSTSRASTSVYSCSCSGDMRHATRRVICGKAEQGFG
jgi:hypothetical protein